MQLSTAAARAAAAVCRQHDPAEHLPNILQAASCSSCPVGEEQHVAPAKRGERGELQRSGCSTERCAGHQMLRTMLHIKRCCRPTSSTTSARRPFWRSRCSGHPSDPKRARRSRAACSTVARVAQVVQARLAAAATSHREVARHWGGSLPCLQPLLSCHFLHPTPAGLGIRRLICVGRYNITSPTGVPQARGIEN